MRLGGKLSAVLLGAAIVIVQSVVAAALTPTEINTIAQQITVRIDGANTGSGVIIEHQGNNYTVVTNWHVVELKGNYTVRTPDNKQYPFKHSEVKRLPGVDLAVFQFKSDQYYRVADKGDSDQVTLGKTVYVGGYPAGITGVPGRNFQFLPGQISSRVPNPKDGYALVYTVQAFQGMSGGPILDAQGTLVGIHGRSGTDPGGGGIAVLGIPLKTYLSLAPSAPSIFTLAKTLTGHSTRYEDKTVNSVAFSPDGRTLASGSGDGIKIWNVASKQEIRTLKGYNNRVLSVAFSPDGKTLAGGSFGGLIYGEDIKIWNFATGQEIRTLRGDSALSSNLVVFSPDGKTLASSNSGNISIWNVATGQETRISKVQPTFFAPPVTFSPDGKTLASSSEDATIKIWNVATGQEIRTFKVQSFQKTLFNDFRTIAFSPDGKTLASDGAGDTTIKIWNVASGQEIRTLKGHNNRVLSVAFSPDGKTLASGSSDKTIKIWNLATGRQITTLEGHSDTVTSVAFSPDGKTLASGSHDATIKIWQLSK